MIFGQATDLGLLIFAVTLLYASVGQAGVSGHLAAMGLTAPNKTL